MIGNDVKFSHNLQVETYIKWNTNLGQIFEVPSSQKNVSGVPLL
jgi:hypothetical protein